MLTDVIGEITKDTLQQDKNTVKIIAQVLLTINLNHQRESETHKREPG